MICKRSRRAERKERSGGRREQRSRQIINDGDLHGEFCEDHSGAGLLAII